MIKKLDTLIIKAFVGPFLATFLISLFVLVLQFFWLYIDDLVGKGLDLVTLGKLTGYVAAFNVPMALPLALLLSSIMTFGNLGETFELVAIKSAGIPLLRFMQPLLIVTIFIGGIAFLFANNIIPVVNLKLNTLKYDIIVSKPAFDIKEGIFYDKIDGYVIKIGRKSADGAGIFNVVIYEKSYGLQDFSMVAESGTMRVSDDKKFLEFDLHNGWRYQEKGSRLTTNTEYVRLGFKDYKKILDLGSFKMNKTSDSAFKDNFKMLSIRQLNTVIDSLEVIKKSFQKRTEGQMFGYFTFPQYADSPLVKLKAGEIKAIKSIKNIIPDSAMILTTDRATQQVNAAMSSIDMQASEYIMKRQDYRFHLIEWHRKFTLSVACVVLFLIGAPLGSIIRKGGLGLPLVFAVIFFVIFHLFNTFGEKLVKEGVMTPFGGMWLSTGVLIPFGVFLTYKAMRDSTLFNQEGYYRAFNKIKTVVLNFKGRNK